MFNFLPSDLQLIENQLGVELVAATIYGSHTRGYSLKDSDYDIAFIFRHTAKTVLPLNTTLNQHFTFDGRKYDVNAVELRAFAAAAADGNSHAVLQLFGAPVHNEHLLKDMRLALLRCGRSMVVHKLAMATRGTFLAQRKESEIAKAHITSLWMFIQALVRSDRKYDHNQTPMVHFHFYVSSSALPQNIKDSLLEQVSPYVMDLVAGVRQPMRQGQLNVLIEAINWLAGQHTYDLPVIEPERIKYTRGDENDVTRDMADSLSRHGEL